MKERNKGITLVALVITIIIMLILAAITIGATVNGGLFNYAGKTKTSGDDAKNREEIQSAYLMALGKSKTNGVSIDGMQQALDKVFGQNYAEAMIDGDNIVVKIGEKYYIVDKDGKVGEGQTMEPIPYAGDITKGGKYNGNSKATAYRIECIEDLVKLSMMAYKDQAKTQTKYYLLTRDLDFNSIFSYGNYQAKYSYVSADNAYEPDANSETTIKELCTTDKGFIPIGLEYGNAGATKVFQGTFYGTEQRTIKNIYIKTSNRAALFGGTKNATIENITVEGSIRSTAKNAAGIVANGYGTTIQKCHNKAKIQGGDKTAGIFGEGGTIQLKECVNTGNIISSGNGSGIAGGLLNDFTIDRCCNLGAVEAGYSATGIFDNTVNAGTYKIVNCYNGGTITGKARCAAGITRWWAANVYNCYNTGKIAGANINSVNGVAGICAHTASTAINCCSLGDLEIYASGTYKSGNGFIMGTGSTITNSYYLNGIEGTTGITAKTGEVSFVETSNDENAMTTAKVVAALNSFIESPPTGVSVSRTGWCKWVVGENNLPALDFKTTWNGTTWVTANN